MRESPRGCLYAENAADPGLRQILGIYRRLFELVVTEAPDEIARVDKIGDGAGRTGILDGRTNELRKIGVCLELEARNRFGANRKVELECRRIAIIGPQFVKPYDNWSLPIFRPVAEVRLLKPRF